MPDKQISFKTRVKNTLIQYAGVYYTQFVCRDYLLISDAFHNRPFYKLDGLYRGSESQTQNSADRKRA